MKDESLAYARRLRESGVMVHEHTLGPSGWPDALAAPGRWIARVREAFAEFFAAVAPGPVPAVVGVGHRA